MENTPANHTSKSAGVCATSDGCPGLPEDLLTHIREELTCAICFDVATRPATLPCGHSGCRRCLNAALAGSLPADKRRCPVCRQQLPLGLPPLAINSTLKNIAELLLPEECKERAQTTPEEERRPQEWVQRVLLTTRSRAVSLHTTHEITPQAHRSAVAGLNALLGVMEERWPEARQRVPARSPAPARAPAPARSPAPAAAPPPARSPALAHSPAPAAQPAHRAATPRSARQPAVPGSQQRIEQPRWRSAAARDPLPRAGGNRGDRTPAAARRLAEFVSPQAAGLPEGVPAVQPAAFPAVVPSPQQAGAAPQPLLTTANRQGVVPSPPLLLRTARQAAIAELAEQLGMMRLGVLGGLLAAAAPPAEQGQQAAPAADEEAPEPAAAAADAQPGAPVALQPEATLVAVPEAPQPAAVGEPTAESAGAAQEDAGRPAGGELPQVPMVFNAGASPRDDGMAVGSGRRRRGRGRRTSVIIEPAVTPNGPRNGRRTPFDRSGLPIWL